MRKRSPCNEDSPPTINPEVYKYSNKFTFTGVGILQIYANSRRYDSYGGSDFRKTAAAAAAAAAAAHFREIAVDFPTGE